MRVWSSVRSAIFRPCPSSPTRRSAGIGTSSKSSSRVGEPLMPSLRSFSPKVKPGIAPLHHERRDAARTGVRVGDRHDRVAVGLARVGDPRLLAAQHPAVAAADGPGAHARGVRSGVALGQSVGEHRLPTGDRRQVALLQVLRRGQQQRHGAELVHRRDQRGRHAAARDLLDHDAGGQRVGPGAFVLDRQVRRVEAHGPKRVVGLAREAGVLVDRRRVRRHLVVHELAHRRAEVRVLDRELVHRKFGHPPRVSSGAGPAHYLDVLVSECMAGGPTTGYTAAHE